MSANITRVYRATERDIDGLRGVQLWLVANAEERMTALRNIVNHWPENTDSVAVLVTPDSDVYKVVQFGTINGTYTRLHRGYVFRLSDVSDDANTAPTDRNGTHYGLMRDADNPDTVFHAVMRDTGNGPVIARASTPESIARLFGRAKTGATDKQKSAPELEFGVTNSDTAIAQRSEKASTGPATLTKNARKRIIRNDATESALTSTNDTVLARYSHWLETSRDIGLQTFLDNLPDTVYAVLKSALDTAQADTDTDTDTDTANAAD